MATPSASLAYVEIAPHSLHVAVLAGRKVVAARAFPLDAKADLAAFIAEHGLGGAARASLLGDKNHLHLSADAESGAVRQPSALQAHLAKLPHGFEGVPTASVCDAANGLALDPTRATPWFLAAVDSAAFASARDTLGKLGLAPAEFTLAASVHLGVVAASLSGDEIALVLVPGEEDASLVWVSAQGVKAVASAPLGYARIFEAVQGGLGLKFKAAASKLFYNDNYDFSDVAAKVAAPLADSLKGLIQGKPASVLHVAGLTPGQSWLASQLASALGMKPWSPAVASLTAKLGLETGVAPQPAAALGVLALAGAGSADAAWVQPTLEVLASRPARVAKGAAAPAAPVSVSKPASKAPSAVVEAKPASVKPGAASSAKPVESVVVDTGAKPAPAAAKSNKGPIFIGAGIAVVATVVGLAMTMRGQKNRSAVAEGEAAPAQTAPAAPAKPAAPSPAAPAAPAATTPTAPAAKPVAPATTPAPAPAAVVVTAPAVSAPADLFASDSRKFGNDRYRLALSDKGFLQSLSTARGEVLVESAAAIMLQGSYVGTDGRRKPFNVGGVDDAGYVATVKKSVREGVTVFDVKVTHPRFELEQSFRCLPDKVQVKARFNPLNLRDPRGVISALHTVRLSPVALDPAKPMRSAEGALVYGMKAGLLNIGFDRSVWARDGADGKQTVVAGDNGVAFYFTDTTDVIRNQLDYELAIP